MGFQLRGSVQICFKSFDFRRDFSMGIGKFRAFEHLKAKIHEIYGYPPNQQHLFFGGVEKKNWLTDKIDIVQSRLLSLGESFQPGWISRGSIMPAINFIPELRGTANANHHSPKWNKSSSSRYTSSNGSNGNARKIMHIDVKTMIGKLFTFKVEGTKKSRSLKHKIKCKLGMPHLLVKWGLFLAGRLVEERKPFKSYIIKDNSTLHMGFQLKEGSHVLFRTLFSTPDFTLEIEKFDTLEQVKAKIYNKIGHPTYLQRLIFGGVELKNGVVVDQMDIIQTRLLSCGEACQIQSISRGHRFQPIMYSLVNLKGGGNIIHHIPKWNDNSSPLPNTSPTGHDGNNQELGTGTKHALKDQKAGPRRFLSRLKALKKIQKKFRLRNFGWNEKT